VGYKGRIQMKKRNEAHKSLALQAFLLIGVCVFSVPAQAKYGGGTGEPNDPYLIYTAEQMNTIGAEPNDWDKHFKLMADINLSGFQGIDFNIIGNDANSPFAGLFDGNSKTIMDFSLVSTDRIHIGLFGYVNGNARIRNLGLIDPNVDGGPKKGYDVGPLVGHNDGTVSDCYVSGGSVWGNRGWLGRAGGLAGSNAGTLTGCKSSVSISANHTVGGLVGFNDGTVTGCSSSSSIDGCVLPTGSAGGLVGLNGGTVTDCNSSANVLANYSVGGLVGSNKGTISDCASSSSVSGSDLIGGLVGANESIVRNCDSTSTVVGHGDVGGLVGRNHKGRIVNCHSTGSISGSSNVGGLVGYTNYGAISNCYSLSHVLTTGGNIGGLVGWCNNDSIISGSHSAGNVSGGSDVGGLVGYATSGVVITDSNSSGDVTGNITTGGLIGENDRSTVNRCYASGDVSGVKFVGGLAGYNYGGKISCSYALGRAVGTGSYVGGLAGRNTVGQITHCFCRGDVEGDNYVGGFVGRSTDHDIIFSCYSSGAVTGATNVGGFIGHDQYGVTSACFWDMQASGQPNSGGGTGKTTSEMQDPNTFMQAGWDFVGQPDGPSDIWAIPAGGGYPILWWRLSPLPPLPVFSGGAGEPDDPYLIATASDLTSIGYNPRLMAAHFRLMSNIDLTGLDYFKIGNIGIPLTGVFDGGGFEVSNVSYTSTGGDYAGFFGFVEGENAQIKNLGLIDPDFDAGTGDYVGLLVGWFSDGAIIDCCVEGGSIVGNRYVGGLVGYNYRAGMIHCRSVGSVSGYRYVGGLIGYYTDCSWASGCYVEGISDCYSKGTVRGVAGTGGLVGQNWSGRICNCYSSSRVVGTGAAIGGLVGEHMYEAEMSACYSSGAVEGTGTFVGGLVGYCYDSFVSNCYSVSNVSGDKDVAGLVAWNNGGMIWHCYSVGGVIGSTQTGGLVGTNGNDSGTISACFWDTDTSGRGNMCGRETEGRGCDDSKGKTTAQMQRQSTFADAGWDFVGESANGTEDIWSICEGMDYPKLTWQFVVGDLDRDDDTDFGDFCIFAAHWLQADSSFWCGGGGTDLTNDGEADFDDLKDFARNWLAGFE